jgi:hypothetical protein
MSVLVMKSRGETAPRSAGSKPSGPDLLVPFGGENKRLREGVRNRKLGRARKR